MTIHDYSQAPDVVQVLPPWHPDLQDLTVPNPVDDIPEEIELGSVSDSVDKWENHARSRIRIPLAVTLLCITARTIILYDVFWPCLVLLIACSVIFLLAFRFHEFLTHLRLPTSMPSILTSEFHLDSRFFSSARTFLFSHMKTILSCSISFGVLLYNVSIVSVMFGASVILAGYLCMALVLTAIPVTTHIGTTLIRRFTRWKDNWEFYLVRSYVEIFSWVSFMWLIYQHAEGNILTAISLGTIPAILTVLVGEYAVLAFRKWYHRRRSQYMHRYQLNQNRNRNQNLAPTPPTAPNTTAVVTPTSDNNNVNNNSGNLSDEDDAKGNEIDRVLTRFEMATNQDDHQRILQGEGKTQRHNHNDNYNDSDSDNNDNSGDIHHHRDSPILVDSADPNNSANQQISSSTSSGWLVNLVIIGCLYLVSSFGYTLVTSHLGVCLDLVYVHSRSLLLIIVLIAVACVFFLIAADFMTTWSVTHAAGLILRDRVANTAENWFHYPLRSGVEISGWLGPLVGTYILTNDFLSALQLGTFTGCCFVLASEWCWSHCDSSPSFSFLSFYHNHDDDADDLNNIGSVDDIHQVEHRQGVNSIRRRANSNRNHNHHHHVKKKKKTISCCDDDTDTLPALIPL